jgi:hypothetical protein
MARKDEETTEVDEGEAQEMSDDDDSTDDADDLPDPDREGPTPDSERERLSEYPAPHPDRRLMQERDDPIIAGGDQTLDPERQPLEVLAPRAHKLDEPLASAIGRDPTQETRPHWVSAARSPVFQAAAKSPRSTPAMKASSTRRTTSTFSRDIAYSDSPAASRVGVVMRRSATSRRPRE